MRTNRRARNRGVKMSIPGFTAGNSLYGSGISHPERSAVRERSRSVIESQLRAGGGGPSTKSCTDKYQDCYVDCSVKYPESGDSTGNLNALKRQACLDTCDANFRTCGTFGALAGRPLSRGFGGFGTFAQ